jgi:hypothetical protein
MIASRGAVRTLPALVCIAFIACGKSDKAPPSAADARTGGSPGARAPAVVVKKDNPCSVLLPGEVEAILGTPITMREIVDEATCHFDYDKPAAGGPPFFEIKVYFKDGRTTITATRLASRLLGGDSGFEKLTGIGDEAWLGPMASTLTFVKGDAGVELDLRLVPDAREKGIRLAKLIADRL